MSETRKGRTEPLDALPGDIKKVSEAVFETLGHGEYILMTIKELYATDREGFDAFNQVAGATFSRISHALGENLVMTICRATDPKKVCGHKNMSTGRLHDWADSTFSESYEYTADTSFLAELNAAKDDLDKAVEPFRTARNKFVGHNDEDARLSRQFEDSFGYSIDSARAALDAIEDYLKTFKMGTILAHHHHTIYDGQPDASELFEALNQYVAD